MKKYLSLLLSLLLIPLSASGDNATQIVREAIDHWRGETSRTAATMLVHRPDWQRSMSMTSITKGTKKSLVRFTAPQRDAGNASLIIDNEMWSYSPKVNRIIKIPSSMRTQSWMGSDFSYNDLAKADDIVDQYQHKILRSERDQEKVVTVIESIPKENAPIVWGKEILFIREDKIIIRHEFYDQQLKLVKFLEAIEIKPLGGKLLASKLRMTQLEKKDHWTEIDHTEAEFGFEISDSAFTQSNLRSASQ